jgi:hypothetical protein
MSLYGGYATLAQNLLTAFGGTATFSRDTPGTYTAATDSTSGASVTTASAPAVGDSSPEHFEALQSAGQVLNNPILLTVAAPALGTFVPTPGDRVTFAGVVRRVVTVNNTAPDGTSIVYEIVAAT